MRTKTQTRERRQERQISRCAIDLVEKEGIYEEVLDDDILDEEMFCLALAGDEDE